MSKPSVRRIIFVKEFTEIFRDKRTRFAVIISPLFITPLMLALMGTMISGQEKRAKTEVFKIGVVSQNQEANPVGAVGAALNMQFVSVKAEDAEAQIKDRKLRAAIVLPTDTEQQLASGRMVSLQVMFDEGNESSRAAAGRLKLLFAEAGKKIVADRLISKNLSSELAEPFKVTDKPISSGGSLATIILSMMLPYTLAVASFAGGIHAANDQVAGEKERGTLETLLVSPASRMDIVLGKFLAVCCVCMISSALSVTGLLVPMLTHMKAFDWLARGGVTLTPAMIAVTFLVQLPLAVLFAGVLLAASTFAKNQKEAQTYLGPMFIFVMLPSMASMFTGTEVARTLAVVPILNATLIIKQALSNIYDPVFITIAVAASAVYAGAALIFATKLFQKESVLLKA